MKLKYHLYSSNARCLFCAHFQFQEKMNSTTKVNYCSIISSEVEKDYYCDFYTLKKLEEKEQKVLKPKKL